MNEGLKKFEELMKTDTAFQEKLKAAFPSIEDLIQAHPFTPTRLTKG